MSQILQVEDLIQEFDLTQDLLDRIKFKHGHFSVEQQVVHAVNHVSFDIQEGEVFSLVGESGCGKSTTARTVIRLQEPKSGRIVFDGKDITHMKLKDLRPIRRQMQMIFQDPYASLNPRQKVLDILTEPILFHKLAASRAEAEEKAVYLLERVGLNPEQANRYPHQFSGGQRQRIGIARAIALQPKLIVCDEPVSALDVSIQSQVLNLLKDLQEQRKLTYLFISHDLSVVKFIASRVCVMFLGTICEIGGTDELYEKPLHPYTRFLRDAIPQADPRLRSQEKEILTGEIPSPVNPPSGCRFRTRCPYARDICSQQTPPCKTVGNRQVFCHFPLG